MIKGLTHWNRSVQFTDYGVVLSSNRNFRQYVLICKSLNEVLSNVFSSGRLWGCARSFDLGVWEQHTLEFSDWESQDYCIYH